MFKAVVIALLLVLPGRLYAQQPSDGEYYQGFLRFLQEISLQRQTTLVVLASLDREVATIVTDTVFREYATAMGEATTRAADRLFPLVDGRRTRTDIPPAELISYTHELERSILEATTKAVDELANAGGGDEATSQVIRADLLRRLFSVRAKINLLGRLDPRDDRGIEPVDCLTIWHARAQHDPLLRSHATTVLTSPSLAHALAEFRTVGATLAIASYEQVAEYTAFYAQDGRGPLPAELRIDRDKQRSMDAAWRAANAAMALAIERSLQESGHALAAAAWSIGYLTATEGRTLPSAARPQRLLSVAPVYGISEQEIEAMRGALHESLPQQAASMKKIVIEYERWEREIVAAKSSWNERPPPQALIDVFDALDALNRTIEKRMLAPLTSAIVRDSLAAIPQSPIELPFWRQLQTGQAVAADVLWALPPSPTDEEERPNPEAER